MMAIERVRNTLLMVRKKRLVMIISRAGMLTMSCTSRSGADAKCCLIIPNAGAMAAPAITVSSDMERMVAVT